MYSSAIATSTAVDTDAPPASTQGAPALSALLVLQNQRGALALRYEELGKALAPYNYEIVAVDDGSTDGSYAVLQELATRDSRLRIVRLRRSFGRSAALSAGFAAARGAVIITVDADMATQPEDLAALLAAVGAGNDLVNGARGDLTPRDRLGSRLLSAATGLAIRDFGSGLKAYRADTAREMRLYGNLYRFIPAIASWQGAVVAEIPLRTARTAQQRQIGLLQSARLVLDIITVRFLLNYAHRPMQSIGRIGGVLLAAALVLFGYLAVMKFGFDQDIGNRPLLLLAVLLGAVSVQVLVLGLLAELMIRIYYEVQNKPIYAIREIIGDDTEDEVAERWSRD